VAIQADTDVESGESHPDDPLLLNYLEAAVEFAEDFTGLAIAQRTYEMALDAFPCHLPWHAAGITLFWPPLVGIDSFLALEGGSDGELDEGDDYTVDNYRMPAVLRPVSAWPMMTPATNGIKIRYRAGYLNGVNDDSDFLAEGAQAMPASIKQALLLLVFHFWQNRSDTVEKALSTIPNGVRDLLNFKRVRLGMA
jgi:uncharacterized phiE125 gp8 family phage protein